jgi:uncharacterized protein YifE (UPF0438 family)
MRHKERERKGQCGTCLWHEVSPYGERGKGERETGVDVHFVAFLNGREEGDTQGEEVQGRYETDPDCEKGYHSRPVSSLHATVVTIGRR